MDAKRNEANVIALVEEYEALFDALPQKPPSLDALAAVLRRDGDWTAQGAAALVQLAQDYGSFFLRNALAVALALDMEDGELGL